LDAVDDPAGILALAHPHDAGHHVVLAVTPEDAETDRVADADLADVAHAHRCSSLGGDDDVLDVTRGLDEADAADGHRVLAARNVEIGRASCRERGEISGGAVSCKREELT